MKDPIVGEVRKIRETLAAECDFDLHRIALRQRRVAERWKGRKVSYDDLVPKCKPAAVAERRREYGRKGS